MAQGQKHGGDDDGGRQRLVQQGGHYLVYYHVIFNISHHILQIMDFLLEERRNQQELALENKFLGFIETIDFIFTKKQLFDIIRQVVRTFAYQAESVGTSHYVECRRDNIYDALISILFRQIVSNINTLEMTHENIVKCIKLYRESKQFIESIISHPSFPPGEQHKEDLVRMFNLYPAWHDHRSPGGPSRCTYGIKLCDTIRGKILTHDSQLLALQDNVLLHDGATSFEMLEKKHNVLKIEHEVVCDGTQLNRGEYPVADYLYSTSVDRCSKILNHFPTAIEYRTNCYPLPSAPKLEDEDDAETTKHGHREHSTHSAGGKCKKKINKKQTQKQKHKKKK